MLINKQSPFYSLMSPSYDGKLLETQFSSADPVEHKHLRTQVGPLLSVTNMKTYEPHADACTDLFESAMRDLEGSKVDLAPWLQWYAFDVIGSITFNKRFGFLEERRDIDDMIAGIDRGLNYVKNFGQTPYLHPYLMGSATGRALLPKVAGIPDTMGKFMKVSVPQTTTRVLILGSLPKMLLQHMMQRRKQVNGRISWPSLELGREVHFLSVTR